MIAAQRGKKQFIFFMQEKSQFRLCLFAIRQ